jgi:hypothetical protein
MRGAEGSPFLIAWKEEFMNAILERCFLAAVVAAVVVTGCSYHVTKQLSEKLDLEALYKEYKVKPADLSAGSKCGAPPSVKIVNTENRTADYVLLKNSSRTIYINPKEMMNGVSSYLQSGFEKSHVKVDDRSMKILQIKMMSLQSITGGWSFEGRFKMELAIPEIHYLKTYEGMDNSADGLAAAAYAIHAVTREVIDDPDVRNYILCR